MAYAYTCVKGIIPISFEHELLARECRKLRFLAVTDLTPPSGDVVGRARFIAAFYPLHIRLTERTARLLEALARALSIAR